MQRVSAVLLLLFIVVPIVELVVIFMVAGAFGWLETAAILITVSVVGAWLVRRAGFSVLRRLQGELGAGRAPTNAIVDGLLILVAGALMLTPGFLTDIVGILLLIPPLRIGVRSLLVRRYRSRFAVHGGSPFGGFGDFGGGRRAGDFIDAESDEVDDRRRIDPGEHG